MDTAATDADRTAKATARWTTRRAVESDADAVARIRNATLSEHLLTFATEAETAAQAAERIVAQDARHPILVIESHGVVGGWAQIARFGNKPWHSGLGEASLCIDARLRGQGLGRRLLEALQQAAIAQGYWKLIAMIFAHNHASRRLFSTAGYREVGVFQRHGQLGAEWIDLFIYEQLLLYPSHDAEGRSPL